MLPMRFLLLDQRDFLQLWDHHLQFIHASHNLDILNYASDETISILTADSISADAIWTHRTPSLVSVNSCLAILRLLTLFCSTSHCQSPLMISVFVSNVQAAEWLIRSHSSIAEHLVCKVRRKTFSSHIVPVHVF
jgi:hypothetical protein